MWKETHIGVPAAVPNNPLTKVIFRPIYRSKETYLRSKETYLYVRRNLDRRIGSSAQQSVDKSADALFLFIGQKRPISRRTSSSAQQSVDKSDDAKLHISFFQRNLEFLVYTSYICIYIYMSICPTCICISMSKEIYLQVERDL